jgi:general secretion pathway protein K
MPLLKNQIAKEGLCSEGFALVAVLWLSGLIAVIATGFALSARVNILTHAAALHGQQLEAVADGLTRLTGFRLAADPATLPTDPGEAQTCRWDENLHAEVFVQDQSGLIDINAASFGLLQALAEGLGASPQEAKNLANAIGDFRDADETDADGGPEPTQYPGMTFGPKNAAFEAIEELDQVPGMTPFLYRAFLPHVTIYSLQAGFDPRVMTTTLKAVLDFSPSGEPPPNLAGLGFVSPKRVYGIDVRIATAAGARYRRMAIVTLERQPDRPFFINTWQHGGEFEMGPPTFVPCFEVSGGI